VRPVRPRGNIRHTFAPTERKDFSVRRRSRTGKRKGSVMNISESRMLISSLTRPRLGDRRDEIDCGHVARPAVSLSMSLCTGLRALPESTG
jgi:hypothetical protein